VKADKVKKTTVIPNAGARGLHIMALFQLAVAWPLYDLLSRYPEFFVARQAQPVDIFFLVISLSIALPLLLVAIHALAFRIQSGFGKVIYILVISVLLFFLGHLVATRFDGSAFVTLWAAVFALGIIFVYLHSDIGKMFVSFLSPAILIVPLMFLVSDEVRPLLGKQQAGSMQTTTTAGNLSPVVFIVFDEFPSNALLDKDGFIDASRFPHFSEIAGDAYWYPNATTVATSTVLAIPALLTGRYPDNYRMPHQGEYPDNLFTWLGQEYDLHVQEAVSAMCPASLCTTRRLPAVTQRWQAILQDVSAIYLNLTAKHLLPDLPEINQSWEGFWGEPIEGGGMYEHRLGQLDAFLDTVRSTRRPGLDFIHVNFPHIPYEYLPSGKRYNDGWLIPGLDFASNTWVGDAEQSRQAYERFVMQVGALDQWLGQLLEKLQAEGLYESSLIVLTADHGVSFEPGSGRRDAPPLQNLDANILPVPLIIKVPFQQRGVNDPRNAELIDILPTIAQVLDRELPWQVDGSSLLGEPDRDEKRAVHEHDKMTVYSSSVQRVGAALESAWVAREYNDPASILHGKLPANLQVIDDDSLRVELNNTGFFEDIDLLDDFLPAHANGRLQWPGHDDAGLAFVLNGKVANVSKAYADKGTWKFSAMLPESGFRNGKNTIEIFGLIDKGNGFELVRGADTNDRTQFGWDEVHDTPRDSAGLLIPDTQGIEGVIDYVSRGVDAVEVVGWAIDTAQSRVVEAVLIFDGSELIWQGNTHMLREETHAFNVVIEIGFNAVLPLGVMEGRNENGLRVFAVSDNRRVREILLKQP